MEKIKAFVLLIFGFALSGCVSMRYHQRAVNEARREAIQEAQAIVDQVRRATLTFRDADYLLDESMSKAGEVQHEED